MAKNKTKKNKWVFVKDSGIHGKGVFAKRNIPKEKRIMEYVGERISKKESQRRGTKQMEEAAKNRKVGAVYIFDLNKKWDIDGNVPENIARFANHSCNENCDAFNIDNRIFYYTSKKIKKGQEILIDYGYDLEHFLDHTCKCGSDNCVGFIVAKDDRPKLKKMRSRKKSKSLLKKSKKRQVA
ncbi:MAG: SET domain-containing protein-lysine N-methyltransferase [Opitutaceae bacterium]|nr:SET domain-containing protein-lysine N-methyltransferase [Opitutaceae bacterium]|tara:strand:+ start:984 stop:1529 length:546 start_codon:yes stop_codon:yes gene_type:complete